MEWGSWTGRSHQNIRLYSKLPPSKDWRFAHSKNPHRRPLGGGSHTWKSRVPGFQNVFTAEFGLFLVTIFFFYKFFSKKIIKKKISHQKVTNVCSKKNPEHRNLKSRHWKKNPGYGISNPSTGNRISNRENFPGASRPSKTLTSVLIGTRNRYYRHLLRHQHYRQKTYGRIF